MADLEVDDQAGDGRTITVTAIQLGRPAAWLVISDAAGRSLGTADVSPAAQPVTIRLDRRVGASQELVARLHADDGDGRFDAGDRPLVDDDGELVVDDFDYVVT